MEIGEWQKMDRLKQPKQSSNLVESLITMLKSSIKNSNLKENLQEKYSQILEENETIQYHVLSKPRGKKETILLFESEGEKIVKIPNILLPEGINSRTVLNYVNQKFQMNKEQTQKKNEQWKKEQEKEEILKEDRKYKVTWLANDFTEVIAEDTKETYQFNFMQDYIPLNLKEQLKEGDYIVAKDGKFEKVEQSSNLNKIEDTYIGEVKGYTGKTEKLYMVTDVQSEVIKILDLEKQKEQFIKKEKIELEKGDFIKTKSKGYEKYDGIVPIKNEKMKQKIKNLYDNLF